MPFDPIESYANSRHEFGEHGGVNMSIEASTTFTVMDAKVMPEIFQGRLGPADQKTDSGGCYLYSRHFNPTVYTLGRAIAAIENTEAGYCTASGMAAISTTLMQICNPGDHIVSAAAVYGGTFALLAEYLPAKCNINTSFVDITDLDAVRNAITPTTKVIYCETLSNPTLAIANIPELAKIAHDAGAQLVVDNTFSPLIVTPANHGADVVVHSITKFIGGSSDIIAGAVCASNDFISSLMDLHTGSIMLLGPTMDPQTAFQLSLRLPHLALRMQEHARRAQIIAENLAKLNIPVSYPGLPDFPHREAFNAIRNEGFGAGGILTLDAGTSEKANELMTILQNKYRFGYMAVSLGYFDTLMSCSAASTSSELSDEDLKRAGIKPGLVRMSIGYTGSLEQRWHQLQAALQDVKLIS